MFSSSRRRRAAIRAVTGLAGLAALIAIAPQPVSAAPAPSSCTTKAEGAQGASAVCQAGYGTYRVWLRCGREGGGENKIYGRWQPIGFYSQASCGGLFPWRFEFGREFRTL